jgi:hypothetical protein
MIGLLCFVVAVLASPFKSKIRLEAENATLRHQLMVLRRKLKGGAHLTNNDRWFFVQLYRWFPWILPVLARDGRLPRASAPLLISSANWTLSPRIEPRNGQSPCADRSLFRYEISAY